MMRTTVLIMVRIGMKRSVQLLIFVVCESIQDNLGFSPFELGFGHFVRGPLMMLKEAWMSNVEPSIILLEYVATFKTTFMANMSAGQTKPSQSRIKVWYDKRCRKRSFKAGDKLLILLPLPGHPLQVR